MFPPTDSVKNAVDMFPTTDGLKNINPILSSQTRKRLWICSHKQKNSKDIQPIVSSHIEYSQIMDVLKTLVAANC